MTLDDASGVGSGVGVGSGTGVGSAVGTGVGSGVVEAAIRSMSVSPSCQGWSVRDQVRGAGGGVLGGGGDWGGPEADGTVEVYEVELLTRQGGVGGEG